MSSSYSPMLTMDDGRPQSQAHQSALEEITRLRAERDRLRDVLPALKVIAEGYPITVDQDQFIVVENPAYLPDDGSDPNIVIDVFALLNEQADE